jgi:hypothetical protein
MPYVIGLGCALLLWFLIGLASTGGPWQIVIGEDGRPSTSKFQLLLWTLIAVFAYAAIEYMRMHAHNFSSMLSVPPNLLIAIGISGGTAIAAKAIAVNAAPDPPTVTVAAVGPIETPAGPREAAVVATTHTGVLQKDVGGLLQGDDGKPDLGKLQVITWTGIAVAVFLVRVIHNVHTGIQELPDIDETQMILMGIGHGTYLGKKIAES